MKARTALVLVAISLALVSLTGQAIACPSKLRCSNFTESEKRADCNFVMSQNLKSSERQNILCAIWDGEYNYPFYQPGESQPVQFNLTPSIEQIENSRYILAGKITVFLLFNYFLISLTKSLYIKKWLNVA